MKADITLTPAFFREVGDGAKRLEKTLKSCGQASHPASEEPLSMSWIRCLQTNILR